MNVQEVKRRFGIVGRSVSLDQALETAVRVANTELTVLISGESGVGKEVFSKVIHAMSARKHHAFIAVNCGAIPVGTINSELFGHEKGAFTGATADRKGYFETVDNGTIFLDEISEMPKDTQAYLLRVLESGEFMRVGSSVVRKTNVRVVAASNVDLEKQVQKGKFRQDLFYRLNTVPIHVPSLKERREDISILFKKFVADFSDKYRTDPIRLDDEAEQLLINYAWPGNVRELKNLAEQLSVLTEKRIISAADLMSVKPAIIQRNLPAIKDEKESFLHERDLLYRVLFDMQKDMTQLKKLVHELVKSNNLQMPDFDSANFLAEPITRPAIVTQEPSFQSDYPVPQPQAEWLPKNEQPRVVDANMKAYYEQAEVVEESLSLEKMEKDFIEKALEKHNNRRKEAAKDLGISERTLYRKIKQYGLE